MAKTRSFGRMVIAIESNGLKEAVLEKMKRRKLKKQMKPLS